MAVSAANGIAGASLSNEWSEQEQVEAAMMWIVTQREEAAEAKKLDEARVSSERAVMAMEQSRKEEAEQQLKNADLVDLIGTVDESKSIDEGFVEIPSKFFPCSVVLQNNWAKRVFTEISSCSDRTQASRGKDQVARFLSLENKARKWYGTVLPFSYFKYIACPCFESWAKLLSEATKKNDDSFSAKICERLSWECDKLEKAMYNLSEQEEGGVGNVPKLFLKAQREASTKGNPIFPMEDPRIRGDDVEIMHLPLQINGINKSPIKWLENGRGKKNTVDVIEIT